MEVHPRQPPTTQWAAFASVDRINAPLSGFRSEHGNLSVLAAIRRPRRRSDGSGSDHGDHVRGGRRAFPAFVRHPDAAAFGENAFFPKRKVYEQVGRACNTCNTYSPAYKGKDLKKRLSPKSVNTLIHQCITFYVFLIFQYLSLWKSVFSPD